MRMAFLLFVTFLASFYTPSWANSDLFADFSMANLNPELQAPKATLKWIDVLDLGLRGHSFNDSATPYDRLPKAAEGTVRPPVWILSRCTAGFYVAFETNSPSISVNYTLRYSSLGMWHFPPTGVSGIDLYSWDTNSNQWRWVSISTVIQYPISFAQLFGDAPSGMTKYLLFLPTYNGVTQFHIGVNADSTIQSNPSFNAGKKPLVWYGTSILQGGVASRPGVAFTNNLTMFLGRDVLNFGFSGNGKMEIEVMQYLVRLDPIAFIIDCSPNMDAEMISERTIPLVQFIRKSHPNTKIFLAEQPTYGHVWFSANHGKSDKAKRLALSSSFQKLIDSGVTELFYIKGDQFYGQDEGINPTVDGTHPTDLGMYRYAQFYRGFLPHALGNE